MVRQLGPSERKTAGALSEPPRHVTPLTTHIFLIGLWTKPVVSRKCGPPRAACATLGVEARAKEIGVKGSQKPKSAHKKPAQKTLKERRSEKKAAAKTRGLSE
jgi:hypothetical protein